MKKSPFFPAVLLLCLTLFACLVSPSAAHADTTVTFEAIAPTMYESGQSIGTDDTISYFVYCGTVQGVYTIAFNMTSDFVASGGENINVGLCATSPGTYYFVATAYSFLHQTESIYSNEVNRTFSTQDFTQIPMSPFITSVSP